MVVVFHCHLNHRRYWNFLEESTIRWLNLRADQLDRWASFIITNRVNRVCAVIVGPLIRTTHFYSVMLCQWNCLQRTMLTDIFYSSRCYSLKLILPEQSSTEQLNRNNFQMNNWRSSVLLDGIQTLILTVGSMTGVSPCCSIRQVLFSEFVHFIYVPMDNWTDSKVHDEVHSRHRWSSQWERAVFCL